MQRIALFITLVLVACSMRQKIQSHEAYLLQNYGSPDGKWTLDAIEPQARLKNAETGDIIQAQFQLEKGEYPVFANWSPDSSTFAIFEAEYRLGCPLNRFAIYTIENHTLTRSVYKPDYIPNDGGCMRATWSPDGQFVALMMGEKIIVLNKQGSVVQEFPVKIERENGSIQSLVWIDAGILFLEKITYDAPYGVLHYVDIGNETQKILYRSPDDLVLAGAQGKHALIISSIQMYPATNIVFIAIDVKSGNVVNTYTINDGQYCGSLISSTTLDMILAFGSREKCSLHVKAVTVNLGNKAEMKEHGEIFGLMRWDANTSSFIVLRGTEKDGLWLDTIKP